MNKIKELRNKLEDINHTKNMIVEKLQEEYNKVYDDSTIVQDLIKNVESSTDYMFDSMGDIVQYLFVDLSDFKNEINYLDNYLSDYGIHLDISNYNLTICQFDSIIINDEGDIFQNGKLIFNKEDYTTEKQMNELIEYYMKKTGVYPGIFRVDHYNNVYFHNTLDK